MEHFLSLPRVISYKQGATFSFVDKSFFECGRATSKMTTKEGYRML